MAVLETHAMGSPLFPNPQQHYQKDMVMWETYVIIIKILFVGED